MSNEAIDEQNEKLNEDIFRAYSIVSSPLMKY